MTKKILFVLTSHDQIGDTGKATGYYMGEASHPWHVLKNAGYEIDYVSPKGGLPPVYGANAEDPVDQEFLADMANQEKLSHSVTPEDVNADHYAGIFYAGGHGPMWDIPVNEILPKIAARIYENNGIVGAVCHGSVGLVNIKLSDGTYLIKGKRVNGFTNEEETIVQLEKIVPFLLEDKLIERGALYEKSEPWHVHVACDQRVISGQNPQSAKAVGEKMLEELTKLA